MGVTAVTFYPTNLGQSDNLLAIDRGLVVRQLKLNITGVGGQTNTISAHSLGFEKIYFATSLFDADNNKGYPVMLDPVNDLLILLDGSAAPAPVDVTTTSGYITIVGFPKVTTG